MDVEKSQKWFGELWNNTIVPYLSQLNKEFTVRVCVFEIFVHLFRDLPQCLECYN